MYLLDFLTFEMLTSTFAAGLSNCMLFKMVAPSFVIWISPVDAYCRILLIPFGPKVVFTTSPIAIAPTNEERRADSDRSSVALKYDCMQF